MKVKINTHGNALPEVHGEWIDLCTAEDVTLDFLEYKIISLGVSIEIPAGYYAHVVPRSSTFGKWGILLANSMGVIENDYCGDGDVWGYPALCLRKEGTRIPKGTRICQFRLVEKAPDMEFVQVESLGNRDRGGFGSTGEQVHTGGTAERNKPERNSRVERMFGERESWVTAEEDKTQGPYKGFLLVVCEECGGVYRKAHTLTGTRVYWPARPAGAVNTCTTRTETAAASAGNADRRLTGTAMPGRHGASNTPRPSTKRTKSTKSIIRSTNGAGRARNVCT